MAPCLSYDARIRAPTLVTIGVVRHEEDIIEASLRHAALLADRLTVAVHRSEDRTEAIIRSLMREGLPLSIRRSDATYHAQRETLTQYLREEGQRDDIDWILPLDADEFLLSAHPLQDILPHLPLDQVTLIPWQTYVPHPSDDADELHPLKRITYRRERERPQFFKVLIPRTIASHPGVALTLGNHDVLRADGTAYPAVQCDDLWLAHLPVRSDRQLRAKVLRGWESHLRDPHRLPGQIFQWEALYHRCRDPRPIDAKELHAIAIAYAVPRSLDVSCTIIRDPVTGVHPTLRYTAYSPVLRA